MCMGDWRSIPLVHEQICLTSRNLLSLDGKISAKSLINHS